MLASSLEFPVTQAPALKIKMRLCLGVFADPSRDARDLSSMGCKSGSGLAFLYINPNSEIAPGAAESICIPGASLEEAQLFNPGREACESAARQN